MNDPSGRFQLVDSLTRAPGVCWVTRTDKGPFIDTGTEIEFGSFGRLYLSVEAIREMADVAGLFDIDMSEAQNKENSSAQRGYDLGVKENIGESLRDIVNRLDGVAYRLSGGPQLVEHEDSAKESVAVAQDAGNDDEAEPPVFVTVSDTEPVIAERADEAATASVESDRQGDSSTVNDRPSRVSSSSSDVNPFRI